MKVKEMRITIPENLYKRYRILCLENDLSVPKQTIQLLTKFVEIHEENTKLMKSLKKKKIED